MQRACLLWPCVPAGTCSPGLLILLFILDALWHGLELDLHAVPACLLCWLDTDLRDVACSRQKSRVQHAALQTLMMHGSLEADSSGHPVHGNACADTTDTLLCVQRQALTELQVHDVHILLFLLLWQHRWALDQH